LFKDSPATAESCGTPFASSFCIILLHHPFASMCIIQKDTTCAFAEEYDQIMQTSPQHKKNNALDYLLYALAGTVIGTLLFSILLWLLF
jgi:hypothetical protein